MEEERPKVGIGVFILKGNQLLLGKRKNSHGIGEYGGSGGHLENGETFEECALRELEEEVGPQFRVKNLGFLCLTNLRRYLPKHYVDIGIAAEWKSGEPLTMEPEKLHGWNWYDLDGLPQPLFGCEPNYVTAYRTGQTYFNE